MSETVKFPILSVTKNGEGNLSNVAPNLKSLDSDVGAIGGVVRKNDERRRETSNILLYLSYALPYSIISSYQI
nr:MAG TPA: hypothetical protein [Caudoviricetes sp.]